MCEQPELPFSAGAAAGAQATRSEALADCILVFHLSGKQMFHGAKGQSFRTHPMSFVDASATANRMASVCPCVVVPANDENLDRYAEAPCSVAVCAALRKKRVKRFDLWASLRRGTYTN